MERPTVDAMAARLGYELVEPLVVNEQRQCFLVRSSGERFVLKIYGRAGKEPYPVHVHREVLGRIPVVGSLVVPAFVECGEDEELGHFVVMTHLDGVDQRTRWSYDRPGTAGGRALGAGDIDRAVRLLIDLRAASPALLAAGVRRVEPDRQRLLRSRGALVADGFLDDRQAARVEVIAGPVLGDTGETDPGLLVTNHDFRFSNMIVLDDAHTGLVDWDHANASAHELTHCVAYLWLLLFGRVDLRRRLVALARAELALDRERFRAMLVVRAAQQAEICRAFPDRRRQFADDLLDAVDDRRFASTWT